MRLGREYRYMRVTLRQAEDEGVADGARCCCCCHGPWSSQRVSRWDNPGGGRPKQRGVCATGFGVSNKQIKVLSAKPLSITGIYNGLDDGKVSKGSSSVTCREFMTTMQSLGADGRRVKYLSREAWCPVPGKSVRVHGNWEARQLGGPIKMGRCAKKRSALCSTSLRACRKPSRNGRLDLSAGESWTQRASVSLHY